MLAEDSIVWVMNTIQPGRTGLSLQRSSHRKLQFLADSDGRTLVKELDILLDEALRARGLDPETLQPVEQERTHAS